MPDLNDMNISVVYCGANPKDMMIYDYFRNMVSSAPQGGSPMGRNNPFLIMDTKSMAVLGIFTIGDAPMKYPYFQKYIGADGWLSGNESENELKWKTLHTVLYILRCLPLHPFGELLIGKLIVLLATSTEIIKLLEQKYSYRYTLFLVRTLHGKSSLYHRLHPRGLEYIGSDETNRGMYVMELRKHGLQYLRGERELEKCSFKRKTHSISEQYEYWKERWFLPRVERIGTENIKFDKGYYSTTQTIKRYEEMLKNGISTIQHKDNEA
jgi:hypothetical protein